MYVQFIILKSAKLELSIMLGFMELIHIAFYEVEKLMIIFYHHFRMKNVLRFRKCK